MAWVHGVWERVKAVTRKKGFERQLDSEMQFHLDMETEENMRSGMSEEEARRTAMREFGRMHAHKEATREERGIGFVEDILRELRYAFRRLRKRPSFGIVVILTLGFGIGATTAIFSVVNSILIRPLDFPNADRLVLVGHEYFADGQTRRLWLTTGAYFIYRDESRLIEELGGFGGTSMSLTDGGQPERVRGTFVTSGFFSALGVRPVLGRTFVDADDLPGAEPTVVISYGLWQRRFAGDHDVLDRTLRINNVVHQVIGVMTPDFQFPSSTTVLWRPQGLNRAEARSFNWSLPAIARLAPGVTPEDAVAELNALLPRQYELWPSEAGSLQRDRAITATVQPLKAAVVGNTGDVLWVLLAGVAVILVIACANVANLFLVQAEDRERELVLRRALGANAGQVAKLFLVQSLVLGIFGGLVGIAIAYAGVEALRALAPPVLPRMNEIAIDKFTLALTSVIAVGAGLLFGLFPLLRYRRPSAGALHEGGTRTTTSKTRARTRNVLVVAQLALTLVLLTGAGLMFRTFANLRGVHPGFETNNLLTFQLALPIANYPGPDEQSAFHMELVDRLRALPGVRAATGVFTGLPLEEAGLSNQFHEADFTDDEEPGPFPQKIVVPGYFEALGVPLIAGRTLERADFAEGNGSAVVSEGFTKRYWPEPEDAVGGRFRLTFDGNWYTIVGVVGDVHDAGLRAGPPELVYWAMRGAGGEWYYWPQNMDYAVRTELTAEAMMPAVRRIVHDLDPTLPVYAVQTMDQIISDSLATTAFTMVLLVIGAIMALLIGTVGIYGVMSYVVSKRTREIGVRMAMGAATSNIYRMVLRHAFVVIVVGTGFGIVGAIAVTRVLRSLLFGVDPVDPLTYVSVALILGLVALAATYLPARRAAGVDPTEALRWE